MAGRLKLLAILVALAAILLLSSATYSRPKRAPVINEAFLMNNNDNIMEAVQTVAEAMCIQDKATGYTPQQWMVAAAQCADSYRDDDGETTSNDGGWIQYRVQAFNEVRRMCEGRVSELCKWVR